MTTLVKPEGEAARQEMAIRSSSLLLLFIARRNDKQHSGTPAVGMIRHHNAAKRPDHLRRLRARPARMTARAARNCGGRVSPSSTTPKIAAQTGTW
jgi:hypothetical protein